MEQPAAIQPVRTLREHITNLEAALTLAVAAPAHKPVHRLRTTTRRIEALLALLQSLVPSSLPLADQASYTKALKSVSRRLRKLRRAAGQVRDYDVQCELIDQLLPAAAPDTLRAKARKLQDLLQKERETEAASLRKLLEHQRTKLAPDLEELLETLEPAAQLSINASQLSTLVHDWYEQKRHSRGQTVHSLDEDGLHGIRKRAKLARYMAEAGGDATSTLAVGFETLQELGGRWHDLLTLANLARRHLGKRSALARLAREQSEAALTAFHHQLPASVGGGARSQSTVRAHAGRRGSRHAADPRPPAH